MNKKTIAILILGVMIGIGVTGCMNSDNDSAVIRVKGVSATEINSNIVEVVGHQKLKSDELFILKDKETGKKFMLFKGYRQAGLTQIN
ncbi:hypothetical protein [Clostridium sporogenes]|uniref:hypothetical protein n=1 Tax=Clostridium sporogenes TaxID=1509 RepID=UPI0006B2A3B0|nr:hypothetical protein [Clostridium sporogenes]KOY65498.1 hypothetical protein AN649_13575 [Clostridium sporogenes]MDS1006559.1 hypothetical protein [Clostridium sporogenes]